MFFFINVVDVIKLMTYASVILYIMFFLFTIGKFTNGKVDHKKHLDLSTYLVKESGDGTSLKRKMMVSLRPQNQF